MFSSSPCRDYGVGVEELSESGLFAGKFGEVGMMPCSRTYGVQHSASSRGF